jgi:hypothetical protein
MIESAEALANAAAIGAVAGIDGLVIGASDLLWETGHPGDSTGPVLRDALHRGAGAARGAGKFSGMGSPREEAVWQEAIAAGIRSAAACHDFAGWCMATRSIFICCATWLWGGGTRSWRGRRAGMILERERAVSEPRLALPAELCLIVARCECCKRGKA